MSLLPSSTFAGPGTAEALWAAAGAVGPGGGVTQLVAGEGILLDPGTGDGVVTITATGGAGGGGVDSITSGGAGLGVSSPTGSVVLTNTGVTSLVAGAGISISGSIGTVTVTNAAPLAVSRSARVTNIPQGGPAQSTGIPIASLTSYIIGYSFNVPQNPTDIVINGTAFLLWGGNSVTYATNTPIGNPTNLGSNNSGLVFTVVSGILYVGINPLFSVDPAGLRSILVMTTQLGAFTA